MAKRNTNWSSRDSRLLIQLIEEKQTLAPGHSFQGAGGGKRKMMTDWLSVVEEFNKKSDCQRDMASLKKKLKNIRQRGNAYALEINKTGGGPPPPPPSEDVALFLEHHGKDARVIGFDGYDTAAQEFAEVTVDNNATQLFPNLADTAEVNFESNAPEEGGSTYAYMDIQVENGDILRLPVEQVAELLPNVAAIADMPVESNADIVETQAVVTLPSIHQQAPSIIDKQDNIVEKRVTLPPIPLGKRKQAVFQPPMAAATAKLPSVFREDSSPEPAAKRPAKPFFGVSKKKPRRQRDDLLSSELEASKLERELLLEKKKKTKLQIELLQLQIAALKTN